MSKSHRNTTSVPPHQSPNGNPQFPLFPKLPPELRLMIWKTTCFLPRSIDIRILQSYSRRSPPSTPRQSGIWFYGSTCHPPALLHTNREARLEGLRWYSPEFGFTSTTQEYKYTIPPQIYINWDIDLLVLLSSKTISEGKNVNRGSWVDVEGYAHFMRYCREKKIKRLAIDMNQLESKKVFMIGQNAGTGSNNSGYQTRLNRRLELPSLHTLICFHQSYYLDLRDEIRFYKRGKWGMKRHYGYEISFRKPDMRDEELRELIVFWAVWMRVQNGDFGLGDVASGKLKKKVWEQLEKDGGIGLEDGVSSSPDAVVEYRVIGY